MMTTLAPSAVSRCAVAQPMPDAPPVTTARRRAIRPAEALPPRSVTSAEPDTAVDSDRLPGHVRRVGREQPGDCAGDVGAGSVPGQRNARCDQSNLLVERRACGAGP